MAAVGIEYTSSNTRIAFPFTEDSPGITSGTIPVDLFIDAGFDVSVNDPVYLEELHKSGEGRLVLSFRHGDGLTSLEISGVANDSSAYIRGVKYSSDIDIFVILDKYRVTELLDGLTSLEFGTSLQMEASTVQVRPLKVDSIIPINGEELISILKDNVQLRAGENIVLDSDDGAVTINALPLAENAHDCLNDIDVVGAAPVALSPKEGNVSIEGDDCYIVTPFEESGIIKIHSICYACCTCDEFADVITKLNDSGYGAKDIYTTVTGAGSAYKAALNKSRDEGISTFETYVDAACYIRGGITANGDPYPLKSTFGDIFIRTFTSKDINTPEFGDIIIHDSKGSAPVLGRAPVHRLQELEGGGTIKTSHYYIKGCDESHHDIWVNMVRKSGGLITKHLKVQTTHV